MDEIQEVKVSDIQVSKNDVRLQYDTDEIAALAHSIARLGLISPLVLVGEDPGFRLVAGHRRLAACKMLNLDRVSCIVKTISGGIEKEVSLGENLYRKDLSPVEMASAIKDGLDEGVLTVDEMANALHRSGEWVRRQVGLLAWPEDVLKVVHLGTISVSAAHNIALITDDAYRGYLLKTAVENGVTARTTAAWLQAWRIALPREVAVTKGPVVAGVPSEPALPQAPCICCGELQRTDALSLVMICSSCIGVITSASRSV